MARRPNTLYLWYPSSGTIDLGENLEDHPDVIVVRSGGLQDALDLAEQKAQSSKFSAVEIHCHGNWAHLHLGARDAVDIDNVWRFGQRLRGLVRTGGLVELLVCDIAGQEMMHVLPFIPRESISGYVPNYHDALIQELERLGASSRMRERDILRLLELGEESSVYHRIQNRPGSHQTSSTEPSGERGFVNVVRPARSREDWANATHQVNPERDGLTFCQTLAESSGAVVRGGVLTQHEEGGDLSEIGNWEGPVFDFHSDRSVHYHGFSTFRSESWQAALRTRVLAWRAGLATA